MRDYSGLKAEAWDLLRGDTSSWPDRAFYREVIARAGQPALDVGCGTGRLLLDYLQQGIDIDGVDNSDEMLALCRKKAATAGVTPQLFEQEMATLDLPRRYRTILVPSSTLQLLTAPEDAASAMARLHAHLEPGGVLVASFMKLRSGRQPLAYGWMPSGEARRADGAVIRRLTRGSLDPATSIDDEEERFEVVVDGAVVATESHRSAVREYTLEQSLALFAAAGLGSVHATRDFSFEPAGPDDRIWCAMGTRA